MSRCAAAVAVLNLLTPPLHAGERIQGTVTHVRDVDTIEVSGRPIRLNGLDGPELDEKGGRVAKRWLTRKVLHKPVSCELTGEKTYDRWVGTCYTTGGDDLGVLAVKEGFARDCPRYSGGKYARYETPESRRLPNHGYCR